MKFDFDKIVLKPDDIDLSKSSIRIQTKVETYVLGAFNPGFTRLESGNLLMMVRIAEALKNPIINNKIHAIRFSEDSGICLDEYDLNDVDASDPRKFQIRQYLPSQVFALTSMSWLLPVELSPDGTSLVKIHYEKAIFPTKNYQEYGVEDARISKIGNKYYMTTCSVSSERHSTTLYSSTNGLDYQLDGIILDHQNKDMLLFEGKTDNLYYALTRPLGSLYFASAPDSPYNPGPTVNLAQSPDLLHWKPCDEPLIRSGRESTATMKIGGGAQPILTTHGWLILYHGVEKKGNVGIYRTFVALLDKDNPAQVLFNDEDNPILVAQPELTSDIKEQIYLEDVVFTTGIIDDGDKYIVASGELDLCCRITHIPKTYIEDIIEKNKIS